ncbi:MAG: hypothetical protein A2X86_17725 [Bdellovibrionales bacterium GWA2_49_15]|nr:MAG: hypothetical protein A2X86_17725 [Bdellovibrionales bacterium GWA2_49_15]HAZ14990.1 hypothetical protein [Bdellovibrionales bacterium]
MALRPFASLIFALLALSSISCSLLNSGTATVKYTEADATFNGVRYENAEKLKDVSFTVKTIQHPSRYRLWNLNFRINPSIHLDRTTFITDETFTNQQGEQEVYPTLYMTRLMGFANFKANMHTPIGGFVLAAGFGGSVYRLTDNAGLDTMKTREVRKLDFAYVAFLSRRFFIHIGPRYIREAYEQYIFAIRLGIFWDRLN